MRVHPEMRPPRLRADPVEAYRAYYRATKVEGARWTNRNAPHWL